MKKLQHVAMTVISLAIAFAGCDLFRTPQQCTEDLEAMESAVQSSVSSGQSCQRDSECVAYDPSNGCFGSCPVALNLNELPRVDREIADADLMYCQNYGQQCGYTAASCPSLEPACVSGRCSLVDRSDAP